MAKLELFHSGINTLSRTVVHLDGDTIVQDQYVVLKDKYDLYYINGVYNYGDHVSPCVFHKILSTIKLK